MPSPAGNAEVGLERTVTEGNGREPRAGFDPLKAALALSALSLSAVLCVLILTLIVALREGTAALTDFGDSLGRAQPTASLATEAVVLRALEGASDLTTALYTMETIVTERRDRTLGPWTVGDTELLYVAHGKVRAGVDLTRLEPGAIVVNASAVRITLPPAQILDSKIDVDRSYVYDLDRSIFGPVDPDLQSRAERYALEQIEAAACEAGVLGEAGARAELAVRTLVAPLVGDDLAIEIQSSPPDDCRTPIPPAEGS